MANMRMLLANDPRSYREVMAGVVQALRPHVEVTIIDPENLDTDVARLNPHLVLCSRLTHTVRTQSLGWIVLYPEGDRCALISVAGTRTAVEEIEFQQVLSVVDEVDRLVQLS